MYAANYSLRLNVTLGLTYDAMRFMICMYDTIGGKVKSGEKRGGEEGGGAAERRLGAGVAEIYIIGIPFPPHKKFYKSQENLFSLLFLSQMEKSPPSLLIPSFSLLHSPR